MEAKKLQTSNLMKKRETERLHSEILNELKNNSTQLYSEIDLFDPDEFELYESELYGVSLELSKKIEEIMSNPNFVVEGTWFNVYSNV